MCDICGKLFCPSACPGYEGRDVLRGVPVGRCPVCGEYLYMGDSVWQEGERMICADCVKELDLDVLMEICEHRDAEELLAEKGFVCRNL